MVPGIVPEMREGLSHLSSEGRSVYSILHVSQTVSKVLISHLGRGPELLFDLSEVLMRNLVKGNLFDFV